MKKQSAGATRLLSELVNLCNEKRERVAMRDYLDGETHVFFLIAAELEAQCRRSTECLRLGRLAARLDIACCADCFTRILTDATGVRYAGYDQPVDFDDESNESIPHNEEIDGADYEELARLDDAALGKALVERFACEETTYIKAHLADDEIQGKYYKAVLDHIRCAAALAKSVGSDSARLWLDALRLMMPMSPLRHNTPNGSPGLNLAPEDVAAAYRRAEEAHARLWIDLQFASLKSPKAAKRGKTVRKAQRKA